MKVFEFNNFDELFAAEVTGKYEVLTIVKENGWINSDLTTKCKNWKTAIRRFFKGLANVPEVSEWYETLNKSAENGCFKMNDFMMADGTQNPSPTYAWKIKEVQEGVWYIFLDVQTD